MREQRGILGNKTELKGIKQNIQEYKGRLQYYSKN